MTAQTGHAALDATTQIGEELAGMADDEARIAFLRAAVDHAQGQLELVEAQYDRVSAKAEAVKAQWDAKVDESHAMRVNAGRALAAYNRELSALEN